MKLRKLIILLFGGMLFSLSSGYAQIVGGDCFLQGHWVEVGINMMGGFGTCTSPATYHSHACCGTATTFTPGVAMDMSYDWGHDGWGTGTPALMGPYSQPGYPQEGWALQIGAIEYRNGAWGGTCTGEYDVPGTISSYSNALGRVQSTWSGGVGGINVKQVTRIDTESSWIVCTAFLYNTTAAPIADIYFERTLDPDNVSYWSGGPTTVNLIVHQNEDLTRRVMVGAWGATTSPLYDSVNSYLALCSKDCRAKCGYLSSGLSPTTTPAFLWALPTTGSAIGALNSRLTSDVGIWIAFNVGTIAPGDSAVVSYAYVFNRHSGIDSAFPDPCIVINGVQQVSQPAPTPDFDTFSACDFPGITSLPLSINYGDDKCWTWGEWTWAPSTGLSATTGTSVNVNIAALSGPTTFTITGTNSAAGMLSCTQKIFYLTVFPCFSAESNSPDSDPICEGDTLKLNARGDSTAATYIWYKGFPGPLVGTAQTVNIFPTTMADTGWYYVIRTVGTGSDTARTHVMIRPKPVVTATFNAPLCSGNTLILTSVVDFVGEEWSWTGPAGFSSTLSDPTRAPAPTTYSGVYTVVTTLNGCMDSTTVTVTIDSTPALPTASSNTFVCEGDTLRLFSSTATPGVTYTWTGPTGFTASVQNPVMPNVPLSALGTYTVTAHLGICTSSATTIVDVRPKPVAVAGSNSPVCSGNALNLTTTAPAGAPTFVWGGPLSFVATVQNPTISPAYTIHTGTYTVIVTNNGCRDTATIYAVVDSTPEMPLVTTNSPGAPGASICEGDTLLLTAVTATPGAAYSWTGPNSFASTVQNPVLYNVTVAASGIYTVVVSVGSCSVAASITVTITVTPPISATSNTPICSGNADTLFLQATSSPGATFTWGGPYTFFSSAQNPFRTPAHTEYSGTYIVTVLLDGCTNVATHNVVVNPTPPPPWIKWLTYCQYYDAPFLQAVGTNILWYTASSGVPGSPVPPKPNTDVVGVSFYFVNQTALGCESAIDSIKVTVNPKPTVTVSEDATICPRDSVKLTALNTDAIAYYNWYPEMYLNDTAGPIVVARPETNIEYTVVSSNMYGCTDSATVMLTVKANANFFLEDSVTLYPGETYQIQPSTNCSFFSWTPAGGLSGKYIANPVASPEVSTKYVVTGLTEWGCKTKDSININIKTDAALSVPNAFAPGNGPNSKFKIIKRGQAALRYFRVYDRWGVVVFETTNIDEGWDGTYKGVPQPMGVYIYDIGATSLSGTTFNKTGNVTLLR